MPIYKIDSLSVPYREAIDWVGFEYQEHDSCKGGVCGL